MGVDMYGTHLAIRNIMSSQHRLALSDPTTRAAPGKARPPIRRGLEGKGRTNANDTDIRI